MKSKTKITIAICLISCFILKILIFTDYSTITYSWFHQNYCQFLPSFTSSETNTKQKILIVSYYRSGSSWFGKMLSKTPNSFYVYEPLHLYELEDISREEVHRGYKVPRLEELLHCSISHWFIWHINIWSAVYPRYDCGGLICNTKNITEHCTSSKFIIIKTVRLFLSEVENIIVKPTLSHVKVIFLVRDPRGVINSLDKMEPEMREKIGTVCSKIRGDIQVYPTLKSFYPNNFLFVRYEDLARNPYEMASEIWSFISKNKTQEIPYSWEKFLNSSSKKKGEGNIGSYNIFEKSTQEWQNWRTNISEELLNFAENECYDVIETLGYNYMGNINKAQNLTYPVLNRERCSNIPCH